MKKFNLFLILLLILALSGSPSSDVTADSGGIDCGDVCNDLCYTHSMEPCTYTYCDMGLPGEAGEGTWMCLGESRF